MPDKKTGGAKRIPQSDRFSKRGGKDAENAPKIPPGSVKRPSPPPPPKKS